MFSQSERAITNLNINSYQSKTVYHPMQIAQVTTL